jgi:adenylosuccinate lyase
VQHAAHAAWDGGSSFADALAGEPEVRALLSVEQIAALLDPTRHLAHLDLLFRRALGTNRGTRRRGPADRPRPVRATPGGIR